MPESVLCQSTFLKLVVTVCTCGLIWWGVGGRVAIQDVEVAFVASFASNSEPNESSWEPFVHAMDL
eukprot:2402663-Pyramimonas_sp.AAC.1